MSFGQGSISFQQKKEIAGPPGPPFLPTSADNGLSVDAISGRIVFGDDAGIGATLAQFLSSREIEMQNFNFQFMNAGVPIFSIEPAVDLTTIGDVVGATTGATLQVNHGLARSLIFNSTAFGQMLRITNNEAEFGSITSGIQLRIRPAISRQITLGKITAGAFDYGLDIDTTNDALVLGKSAAAGTFMFIDDSAGVASAVRIQLRNNATATLALFFNNSVYSIGNVNDTLLGSKISVDDINEAFTFSSVANLRMMALQGGLLSYRIGDIDGTNNNTVFQVDDSAGNTRVNVIAANGLRITGNAAVLIHTGTALTDGAGAALGTIANAPAAGNPTKWIGIDDNGTIRYVPSW